jgi:hypothetical protein
LPEQLITDAYVFSFEPLMDELFRFFGTMGVGILMRRADDGLKIVKPKR